MPGHKKQTVAPVALSTGQAPIIVTIAEKNALADETNPVLTNIPIKMPAPQPISITPPPAYTPNVAPPKGLLAKLRSKLRRPPRWDEDRVRRKRAQA